MKNSKYTYTKGEKEINKALKMQANELDDIEKCFESLNDKLSKEKCNSESTRKDLNKLTDEMEQLRRKVLELAKSSNFPSHLIGKMNLDLAQTITAETFDEPYEYEVDKKIPYTDIPSWEEIMQKTNKAVPEDVILEELLSTEEFQYCIDDVKRINDEFAQKTRLNKRDIAFLITATALQTARWVLIQMVMGELGEPNTSQMSNKEGDAIKKKDLDDYNRKHGNDKTISSDKYPSWKDIVFGQYKRIDGNGKTMWRCPYDAQKGGPEGFDHGGKGNHRVNTLGHDPILGWIFGTANIMTCTISLSKKFNFATYRVTYPGANFGNYIPMGTMFAEVYESLKEDKYRLPAAITAQAAHLKSDKYTPKGLPVPLLETFSPDLASKLYDENYHALCLLKDIKITGTQAAISIIINMIIGLLHGLYYNKEKDGPREHYEVRTRKILLYSNVIASSINIAYVGVNAYHGNTGEALKKLDLGGLLVTLYRMFADTRFITKVKDQFIREEMDKVIRKELEKLDSMFKI